MPALCLISRSLSKTKMTRIAFLNNTAGNATLLARELNKKNHTTDVFVFGDKGYRQWGGNKINFGFIRKEPLGRAVINPFWKITRWKLARNLNNYKVWHYQSPSGALERWIVKRASGHILVKHYNGSDLRGRLDNGACVVSTPDLLSYAPNGTWIKDPIDLNYINQFKKEVEHEIPRVAHYPYYLSSPRLAKDEEIYRPALTNLQKRGKCQVVNFINQTHEKTIQMLAECDIVVGKVMPDVGWFGKFEVEGMILGKRVMAYVAKDLFDKYKPPIHNTSKATFEKDLEALIEDKSEQKRLIQEGYRYATYHDATNVATEIELFYQKLM